MTRKRLVLAIVAVVAVVAVGVLAVTQPWLAFVDTTVDEAFPVVATTSTAPPGAPDRDQPVPTSAPAPPEPVAVGQFVARDKDAAGRAAVFSLDGGLLLRLEDFATSNGPDVFIVLSPHPADASNATLAEGYLSLGPMKGNLGNQNYDIPAGTDLGAYRSVVVWCDQFTSAFGAAELTVT
jgi:hypothetical protein